MKPTCQICSWIQNRRRRVTCSQTKTHFSDVYSDSAGEVHSSSSTTRLIKNTNCCPESKKHAIKATPPSCCCVSLPAWIFPFSHLVTSPFHWLTRRSSSRLQGSEEESDTRNSSFVWAESKYDVVTCSQNQSLTSRMLLGDVLWGSSEVPVFFTVDFHFTLSLQANKL